MQGSRRVWGYALLLAVVLLGGCTHQRTLDSIVSESLFSREIIRSSLFTHIVYKNQLFYSNARGELYVFLEGDGLPWKTRTQISSNPQPVYPLAMDLMSKSIYPSVYVQRPCYGVKDDACHHKWWTSQRYSTQVITSMAQVIREVSVGYEQVVLVGYSGGGALAALVSQQLDNVRVIVTLAGNLDHQQWTKHHAYSDLQGSLNPADYVLPNDLKQFHYAAEKDENILPQWIKNFSDKHKNSRFILIKNADHSCCWVNSWLKISEQINSVK